MLCWCCPYQLYCSKDSRLWGCSIGLKVRAVLSARLSSLSVLAVERVYKTFQILFLYRVRVQSNDCILRVPSAVVGSLLAL